MFRVFHTKRLSLSSFVRSFVRSQTNQLCCSQKCSSRLVRSTERTLLLSPPAGGGGGSSDKVPSSSKSSSSSSSSSLRRAKLEKRLDDILDAKSALSTETRRDMRSKVSRARRLGPDAVGRAETLVQIEKHRDARRKRRRRQRNETRANVLANARRSAVLRVYRVLVRMQKNASSAMKRRQHLCLNANCGYRAAGRARRVDPRDRGPSSRKTRRRRRWNPYLW